MNTITPCLWFDTEGEAAAELYTSVFPNSRITGTSHYLEGMDRAGTVMTVAFELDGRPFTALNGGPLFPHSEAISFQVPCSSQEEIDRYWNALVEGGEEGPCGWLKDRFGVSWQIFPTRLIELLQHPEPATAKRVADAMFAMKRIDLAAIEAAAGT